MIPLNELVAAVLLVGCCGPLLADDDDDGFLPKGNRFDFVATGRGVVCVASGCIFLASGCLSAKDTGRFLMLSRKKDLEEDVGGMFSVGDVSRGDRTRPVVLIPIMRRAVRLSPGKHFLR